ncbi:hypothetical protein Tco_0138086 [Tanacetum coccineum]
MTITRSGMTPEAIEEMITRRVAEALAEQEANRNLGPIVESKSKNGDDNKNGDWWGSRMENEGRRNGRNGNGNQGGNASRAVIASRECTYKEFLNCQPFNFKGTDSIQLVALNLNLIRTSKSEYSVEKSESDSHLNLNSGREV